MSKWKKAAAFWQEQAAFWYMRVPADNHDENLVWRERQRIIKLLEENARPRAASGDDPESFGFREGFRHAIALIKGEDE